MFDFSFDDKAKDLDEILREIDVNVKEIEAAAIVSIEGLPIAARMPPEYEDAIVAAMTAAMLSLGEKISNNLNRGVLQKIFVEGKDGHVISVAAGSNAVLTVSTNKDAKLGLIFHEMEIAAKKIAEILG
ncbi:MAG: hypothetical protein D6732_24165 [Methanobacteriota archaeon]|nr:MAG: hypothetical protein D6732_24165 [Euryarchaeota archaeon]